MSAPDTCGLKGHSLVTYKSVGLWVAANWEFDLALVIEYGNAGGSFVYFRKGNSTSGNEYPWGMSNPSVFFSTESLFRYVLRGGTDARGYVLDANVADGWVVTNNVVLITRVRQRTTWSRMNIQVQYSTSPYPETNVPQRGYLVSAFDARPTVNGTNFDETTKEVMRSCAGSRRNIESTTLSETSTITMECNLNQIQTARALHVIAWNLSTTPTSRYDPMNMSISAPSGMNVTTATGIALTPYVITFVTIPGQNETVQVPFRYPGEEAAVDLVINNYAPGVSAGVTVTVTSSYSCMYYDAYSGFKTLTYTTVVDAIIDVQSYTNIIRKRILLRWPTESAETGYIGTYVTAVGLDTATDMSVELRYVNTNSECSGVARETIRLPSGKTTVMNWKSEFTGRTHNEGKYVSSLWRRNTATLLPFENKELYSAT